MSTSIRTTPDDNVTRGALAAARGLLNELPADEVRSPPMPVDRMIVEAVALGISAESTRDLLLAKGLSPQHLTNLPLFADALAEAQAELTPVRNVRRSEPELTIEAEAVELRAEMMAEARFVFRQDTKAQAALDHIQEGNGLADLVQDLRELAVMVEQNKAAFEKAGLDPDAKAARARAVSSQLTVYVATRRSADRANAGALETRDRAATLLADTMAEIRACAAFALRKQPRLLAKFRHAYKSRRKTGGRAPEAPEPDVDPGVEPAPNND